LSSEHCIDVLDHNGVVVLSLNRPSKRNALSDELIAELAATLAGLSNKTKAIVIHGHGEHFCAGLDLAELRDRSAAEGMLHSQSWHRAFNLVQFGVAPVIAVLHGAVIGGGLELACAAHIRVAEQSAFYALPEGQRGLFVGGGGSVRLPRLNQVLR
jgi:(methylthio)acryloyl-CoA hydratase